MTQRRFTRVRSGSAPVLSSGAAGPEDAAPGATEEPAAGAIAAPEPAGTRSGSLRRSALDRSGLGCEDPQRDNAVDPASATASKPRQGIERAPPRQPLTRNVTRPLNVAPGSSA